MTQHSEEIAQSRPATMASLRDRLEDRLEGIRDWLRENAPQIDAEQKHLDAGSTERAYWHFGYAAALRDIVNCLPGKNDPVC